MFYPDPMRPMMLPAGPYVGGVPAAAPFAGGLPSPGPTAWAKLAHQPFLRQTATGGFPVPQSLDPEMFPPAVKASIMRPITDATPKPAVTLEVMNKAQATMIAPDLPWRADA